MVKCLCIGDSHIPRRIKTVHESIYDKLIDLSKNELFDYTFCTGDIIKAPEFINFLTRRTKKNVFIVLGNMDYFNRNQKAPIYHEQEIIFSDKNRIKIGLTHGAQIHPRGNHSQLEYLTIEKKDNILISGHTHCEEVFLTQKGVLLINPGSITGAWSFLASGIPSFIILKIYEKIEDISVDLYQLDKNTLQIDEFKSYFIFKNNVIRYKF